MKYEEMMEDCIAYVDEHIRENITVEDMAKRYAYTATYFSYMFSVYFEMPFSQYIRKIRLRRASSELLKKKQVTETALQYGFNNVQSFSKAFRREFGMSPREFVKKGQEAPDMPIRREIDHSIIHLEYTTIDPIRMGGYPVVPRKGNETDLLEEVAYGLLHPLGNFKVGNTKDQIAMWWHDNECNMYYLMGPVFGPEEEVPEGMTAVSIPAADYAVFSTERKSDSEEMAKTIKMLAKYVFKEWAVENQKKMDKMGYTFERYQEEKAYLYIPLLKEEPKSKKEKDKVYSVDVWTKYIDDHILENPTPQELAETFHYSVQHFRHIFRLYYDIPVSDYIRKRKLQLAAEEIRQGRKLLEVAMKYNFKTPAGFTRAFEKEFNMTPSAYRQGEFEVVDLERYYSQYKQSLKVSFVRLKELKMIGHTIIPNRGDDVDIPAQVYYWLDRDFPCLENTRFSCNRERREDKIAMWYHDPECINIEYILGPVVENFEGVPDDMRKVVISAGKYAIFETSRQSDKEDLPETIRMFTRCVFYGWIKEYRERVDLMRFTFERYIDNKVYIYVPVKY